MVPKNSRKTHQAELSTQLPEEQMRTEQFISKQADV